LKQPLAIPRLVAHCRTDTGIKSQIQFSSRIELLRGAAEQINTCGFKESVRMNLKICLIVGDNNAQYCGVKDQAILLAKALDEIGLRVELLAPSDWGVKSFLRFCKELRKRQFDIVDLHYPSIGHRKSLCPHLLGRMRVAKRAVVTLHEYSFLPILQRASTHLLRWTADCLLFTTEAELMSYGRSGVKQQVIHIGSSVPAFPSNVPRTPTVIYFGQIRPDKGLEEFLELARRSLHLAKPFKYKIIGSVPERRADFYKTARANSAPEIEWLLDVPVEQVAKLMASSLAAYLPFPDGASYRRSSLLAALTNGLPAITTVGPGTPREMLDVLLPATDPGKALAHLDRLYECPAEAFALSCAEKLFAEKFSWAQSARLHLRVYETLLQARPST
jgi:glycosyltransferase involved in cell wall biosynthesis